MPFKEAFDVSKESGEKAKMTVNADVFAIEGKMGEAVKSKMEQTQKLLDQIRDEASGSLSSDEMDVLMLGIEKRLEGAIPSSFLKKYEDAAYSGDLFSMNWEKAAEKIQGTILNNLQSFIEHELEEYIDIVDAEDYQYLSPEQALKAYKKLASLSRDDIAEFRARYSTTNLGMPDDDMRRGEEAIASRH